MIPLAKNIKRYFSAKELIVVFLAVLIPVFAGVGVFVLLKKEVTIIDNGKQYVVNTMKTTVGDVLEQNGLSVIPEDYINVPAETKLNKTGKNEIFIKRAIPVSVLVDGRKITLMTNKSTVGDALANSSVQMSQIDRFSDSSKSDKITRDMEIRIVRVKEERISEKVLIPFMVKKVDNNHMDKGAEKTVKEGKVGILEKIFKIVYEDGKEITKTLLSDKIILNPIDRIVEQGTALSYKTARGEVFRYKKVMKMRATSYTASYEDTGKRPGDPEFGITRTGMSVLNIKKGVIAVDPRVIPLGTKVYVEVAGSTPDYGYAIAADTGGAIKGDLIDLYFGDAKTVKKWGCKRVKVYILAN